VRQTVMLQSKLLEAKGAAAARAGDLRSRAARIVRRAIADQHGESEQTERLAAEAAERLEEERYGDVLTRPLGQIVRDICRDLGLDPDWKGLAAEIDAAEAFARGGAGAGDDDDECGPVDYYWMDSQGRPTRAVHPYTEQLNRKLAAEAEALRRDSS